MRLDLRRREVRLLTLLSDLLVLAASFEAAVRLRVALNDVFSARVSLARMTDLAPPLGMILVLWIVAGAWLRLYRPRAGPEAVTIVVQVVEGVAVMLVLVIVATFFLRDFGRDFSRSFILLLAALGAAALTAGRALLGAALRLGGHRALGPERVLVVGSGEATRALLERIERTAQGSYDLRGVVTPGAGLGAGVLGNPVPIVGTVEELPALINSFAADRIIAVESEVPGDGLETCLAVCTRMGVPLSHTVTPPGMAPARLMLTEVGDVPVLEVRASEFTRTHLLLKRAMDLAGSLASLAILSPLLAGIAIAVKLSSPGPVLYVSQRVGRGGRHFRFYKFRTMVANAELRRGELASSNEKRGPVFKIADDPRVTPVGRLLRRCSLDELPQLVSVLLGDMSLVGPRPLPARDLDADGMSRDHRVWARERSRVRPGITGLWQVRGRSALPFEAMVRLDVAYVRKWSLGLDLWILLQTVPAVLSGRGAC